MDSYRQDEHEWIITVGLIAGLFWPFWIALVIFAIPFVLVYYLGKFINKMIIKKRVLLNEQN